MSISSLQIGNFKGFAEDVEIPLKPITVIVGANSSGKSSLIHAIAALAQTARITSDTRPLVLDDDSAYVHLGRFIEVIHSKSYQDTIALGIGVSNAKYPVFSGETFETRTANAKGRFWFKCSKRTQEIAVEKASFSSDNLTFDITRSKKNYILKGKQGSSSITIARKAGFQFDNRVFPRRKEQIGALYTFDGLQSALLQELRNTRYLGPFRQGPARRYATRGANPSEVGAMGEAAVTMLANEALQTRSRPHAKQIKSWFQELGLAKSLDVARIGRSDLFDVEIELPDGGSFPLADLGYGLSQILPVLVQCSFAPQYSTLLFEQPEIHLHTLSSRKLATVFRQTVESKKAQVLIETHSPELVKQFFQDIKRGALSRDDFVLYRISRDNHRSVLTEIPIEDDGGVYENWEKGISVG